MRRWRFLRRARLARELAGYALLAAAGVALVANLARERQALRWAVHRAAALVPEPDPEEV